MFVFCVLMSLHAVCEVSCADIWCSRCFVFVCFFVVCLCGLFASYCVMLCGVFLCVMCGFACVVCCCCLSCFGVLIAIYCVMLHGLLLCGCCCDCVFSLHVLVRFVLLFVCAVLRFAFCFVFCCG